MELNSGFISDTKGTQQETPKYRANKNQKEQKEKNEKRTKKKDKRPRESGAKANLDRKKVVTQTTNNSRQETTKHPLHPEHIPRKWNKYVLWTEDIHQIKTIKQGFLKRNLRKETNSQTKWDYVSIVFTFKFAADMGGDKKKQQKTNKGIKTEKHHNNQTIGRDKPKREEKEEGNLIIILREQKTLPTGFFLGWINFPTGNTLPCRNFLFRT